MRAVAKTAPGPGVRVQQRSAPVCPDDGVLLTVDTVGLCGSDLHVEEWVPQYHWMAEHLPVVLGHEIVGTVVQTGPAAGAGVRAGDRVAVRPARTCGRCTACRAGHGQRCPRRTRLGLEVDGGLAELLTVEPKQLWRLAPNVPWALAALVEPCTVAWHAIIRSGLVHATATSTDAGAATCTDGARVAIVGPGPIGLAVTQLLAAHGCTDLTVLGTARDTAVGNDDVARRIGARVARSTAAPAAELAQRFTHVFLTAGAPAAVHTAVAVAARGGAVVPVALGIGAVPVDVDDLVRREVELRPSFGSTPSDWDTVVALMNAGRLDDVGIVSATVGLADAPAAFETLRAGTERKICVTTHAGGPRR